MRLWRIVWVVTSLVVVQAVVCGLALLPVVILWRRFIVPLDPLTRTLVISAAAVPSYVLFALCLVAVSPVVVRAVGWRTPADAAMRIADLDWPLLGWVRYGASIHLTRVLAGTIFRGTPIWTSHLRWFGAKLGRRVYVNSLAVSDYNLLEFDDGVVIGGSVHLSGHTVESGIVRTARVRLGPNVTIGLGSVIEIGVEIGANAQVGALSFVPKYTKLAGGVTYVGVPAAPLHTSATRL